MKKIVNVFILLLQKLAFWFLKKTKYQFNFKVEFDSFNVEVQPVPSAESVTDTKRISRYDFVCSNPTIGYMGHLASHVIIKNEEILPSNNPEYSIIKLPNTYFEAYKLDDGYNRLITALRKSARVVTVVPVRKRKNK